MRSIILVVACAISVTASAGSLDGFMKAIDSAQKLKPIARPSAEEPVTSSNEMKSSAAPSKANGEQSLCISEVCVGDALKKHQSRIDVKNIETPDSVRVSAKSECEENRDAMVRETKSKISSTPVTDVRNRQALSDRLKNQTRPDFCDYQVSLAVQDIQNRSDSSIRDMQKYLGSWVSAPASPGAISLAAKEHPESKIMERNNAAGIEGGVLWIEAKTNVGAYSSVERAGGICQPVIAKGGMDSGKVLFTAATEPGSSNFIILKISTEYKNITRQQRDSATSKYQERFGSLSDYAKISDRQNGDGTYDLLISIYHPAIYPDSSVDAASAPMAEESEPATRWKIGNQFDGTFPSAWQFIDNGWGSQNLSAAYVQNSSCKRITQKYQDIDIR